MKKILLVVVALFCVATASAANKSNKLVDIAATSKYSAGLRLGTGVEAVGEYFYAKNVYAEARIGYNWVGGFDFTAIHAWNPFNWSWTPQIGWWFFDYGGGLFVGGGKSHAHFGIAGVAKFGILLKRLPIRVAVDLTPHIGLYTAKGAGSGFYGNGVFNAGISATYCF